MITIKVDAKNKDFFIGLDPVGRLDMLKLPGSFALGAVDETGEFDIPASLIVCTEETDRLVIDWVYTMPEFRGLGLGSELMMLAFEEASGRFLYDVAARISSEYDGEYDGWDPGYFFVNDVFSDIEDEQKVFKTNMSLIEKRLSEDEKKNKRFSDLEEIVSLSEVNPADLKELLHGLEQKHGKGLLYPLESQVFSADPNVSILRIEKRECTGAVFVMRGMHTWYVLGLIPLDLEETEEIVRAALYRLGDYAKPDDAIEIMLRRKAAEKVLSQLDLPGEEYDISYYTATVSDFEKQKELAERDEVIV